MTGSELIAAYLPISRPATWSIQPIATGREGDRATRCPTLRAGILRGDEYDSEASDLARPVDGYGPASRQLRWVRRNYRRTQGPCEDRHLTSADRRLFRNWRWRVARLSALADLRQRSRRLAGSQSPTHHHR